MSHGRRIPRVIIFLLKQLLYSYSTNLFCKRAVLLAAICQRGLIPLHPLGILKENVLAPRRRARDPRSQLDTFDFRFAALCLLTFRMENGIG